MKILLKLLDFLEQIPKMTIPERLYVLGMVMYCISWLVILTRSVEMFISFTIFSGICFVLGFTIETIQYVSSIWETKFAKFLLALLGLLSIVCWWAAKTLSAQFINLFIPVNPSYFPSALQAFAFIFVIILWLIVAFIFFMLASFVLMSYFIGAFDESGRFLLFISNLTSKDGKSNVVKPISPPKFSHVMGRIMGTVTIAFLIWSLIGIPITHINETTFAARLIIAFTDHYTFSTCRNHNYRIGERIAFLEDNKISVAIPDEQWNYTFEIRTCEP